MIVRGLDVNGDWLFGKGKNDYLVNQRAMRQIISTRLKSFLGDCFFNILAGIDWFTFLGSKDKIGLQLAVFREITNTTGVTKVKELSVELESSREIHMRYEVDTVYTGIPDVDGLIVATDFLLTEGGDIITTESGDRIDV